MPVIVLKVEKVPRRDINRGIQWDNGAVKASAAAGQGCPARAVPGELAHSTGSKLSSSL